VSALGINLAGLLAQIINFTVLVTLLYLLLYKPVVRMLDQRSQRIKESLAQADRLKEDTARAEEEVKKQIEAARQEGRALVAQAQQVADRLREEAREQAKVESDAIVARAKAEVQRERDEAVEVLRRQFADLTMVAAERVVKASLDKDRHRRLIDEVLAESPQFRRN
jgi:F-type H+-transporting ATPase subunit b